MRAALGLLTQLVRARAGLFFPSQQAVRVAKFVSPQDRPGAVVAVCKDLNSFFERTYASKSGGGGKGSRDKGRGADKKIKETKKKVPEKKQQAKDAASTVKKAAKTVKDTAKKGVESAAKKVKDTVNKVKDTGKQASKQVKKDVKKDGGGSKKTKK